MTGPDPSLDLLFHALADPTRRSLWRTLGTRPGATTAELTDAHASITRWAVMKHLRVLRQAGLIQTLPEGRRRRHYRDTRALDPVRTWVIADG